MKIEQVSMMLIGVSTETIKEIKAVGRAVGEDVVGDIYISQCDIDYTIEDIEEEGGTPSDELIEIKKAMHKADLFHAHIYDESNVI